uniref:non-specific serine/threonine protein kinase n=1 Tax=Molossus molossus TaxID=27622 RepID=A0A7J8JWY1_MOLMO|nr:hypothetical protein HJG59_007993 [Molossus molossus]
MFRQLTSAVHDCHQQGIVHRDLQPENILLHDDMNVKLADSGLSAEFTDENLTTFCGTSAYMAPEAVTFQPCYSPTGDMWALGVILYLMLTREMLFVGHFYVEMGELIVNGEFLEPSYISQECLTLLRKLMTVNCNQRPTLEKIMKDPWVSKDAGEELRPYIELPWGDLDPQLTEKNEKPWI